MHPFRFLKRAFLLLRAAYNIARLAMNPQNTDAALALSDRLLDLSYFNEGARYLRSDPVAAAVFQRPLNMDKYDLDKMLELPTESLGHQLAAEMKKQGFDPNYFRRSGQTKDGEIILNHIEQTHDIWHIILGFDTSVAGELGVQGFMLGQLRSPQSYAIVGGAFFRLLFTNPGEIDNVLGAIARGWQIAKRWPPVFAVNWPEIIHLPVTQIQHELDQGRLPTASS